MLEYNVSRRKYQLGGSISMMDGYLTVSAEKNEEKEVLETRYRDSKRLGRNASPLDVSGKEIPSILRTGRS